MISETEKTGSSDIVTRWWRMASIPGNKSETMIMISGWFHGASMMTVNPGLRNELLLLSDMLMDKFAGR